MTSTAPPLKQEIEMKDFKGDIFGTRFSIRKDETTGELTFDFVELPPGFDVKKIKFFRVKGKDIASVETELRKLLKKEVPTADTKAKGPEEPFKKMTKEQLAELDEEKIALHISAGLDKKVYTPEEAETLGKEAKAIRNAKAKAGTTAAATTAAATPAATDAATPAATTAAASSGAAAVAVVAEERKEGDEGDEDEDEEQEEQQQQEGEEEGVYPEAAEQLKAAETQGVVNAFKELENWKTKTDAEIEEFLIGRPEITEIVEEADRVARKAELKAAIEETKRANNAGAPAEGGKRSRKQKKQKKTKTKTRKHKK